MRGFKTRTGDVKSAGAAGFLLLLVALAILEQEGFPRIWIGYLFLFSTIVMYAGIGVLSRTSDVTEYYVAGRRVPVPTRYTLISGFGTALILFTVPLSFTFENVSIPFIQLLMRGDILLIAPLVDIVFGRKVRWWSWTAVLMVLAALVITLSDRGGLQLPPLALATVILYTLGYFIRLAVMTKVSKTGDPASIRKYFVEEKIIALPISSVKSRKLFAS